MIEYMQVAGYGSINGETAEGYWTPHFRFEDLPGKLKLLLISPALAYYVASRNAGY